MARIEKTVFISYRRKDISWALAVYQYLTAQKYDVFFDFSSIPSGDFEQIIVSNIKARAHFVLILTPTSLDRCNNPDDWLRREIETAMDEKRNIVPLLFDGFNFGSASVTEKLTGKLADVKRYNGLDIPSGYFMEAMERLRTRYLSVPLSAIIHPVSTEVKKVIKEEKSAANKALVEQKQEIKELVKAAKEKTEKPKQSPIKKSTESPSPTGSGVGVRALRPYALSAGIILLAVLGVFGIRSLINNVNVTETPSPTQTKVAVTNTVLTPTLTETLTNTSTPTLTSIPPFDYTVRANDTCGSLAIAFGVSVQSIVVLNQLPEACILSEGQVLKIPYPTATPVPLPTDTPNQATQTAQACEKISYVVQENDTLAVIASNYSVPLDSIKSYNDLSSDSVFIGMTLLIPLCERVVAPIPSPSFGIGSTMTGKDGMTLLYVPAGEFTMGSDIGDSDEKPIHTVNLDAFWIDKTEITNQMYSLCVQAGVCKEPTSVSSNARTNYYDGVEFEKYPVIHVDWEQANSYCKWADRHLPTEAEWEKAARGIDGRIYPWGNEEPNNDLLNYSDLVGDTTKVGNYPDGASPYGVLDMAGNVWEWMADWYDEDYYSKSPTLNPPGPIRGNSRVLRGGAWNSIVGYVRSSQRLRYAPVTENYLFGFRCAMSATP